MLNLKSIFICILNCEANCLTLLRGIVYNSSNKGKDENTSDIVTTGSTENCESEKLNTEVENDKKSIFRQCDKCRLNLRL